MAGDVDSAVGCHRGFARPRAYNTRPQRRTDRAHFRNESLHAAHALPQSQAHAPLDSVRPLPVVTLVAAAFLAYGGSKAGYWLEAAGQAPEKANAIVVLGGDNGERSLARAGALPRRLRADHRADGSRKGERHAAGASHVARRLPRRARRPPIGVALRGRIDATATRKRPRSSALMQKQKWQSVIVVSDPPHMRRLCLDLEPRLQGLGIALRSGPVDGRVVDAGRVVARRVVGFVRHHGVHQARLLHGQALIVARTARGYPELRVVNRVTVLHDELVALRRRAGPRASFPRRAAGIDTSGVQPSWARALAASPSSVSTSAGRK